ncbi:MAG: outer membrane lipoprotein-sorting protein [Woeseiaceae bacterium]
MKGIILLSSLLAFSAVSFAQTAEEKGLAIAVEADKRNQGWGDQATVMKMTLRNSQGAESTREIRGKTLEVDGDGDKSLTIFDTPRDVKGTAFLSFTHTLKSDEQWLYLPALKRVKRISSSNKSGPFMGSEFAYEDISSQEVDKYKYKFIRDDKYEGHDVFVIELYPQYKKSGYTKQVSYIDKEIYQPLKIEFYDRKKSLLKTLTQHDYKKYLNKFWRAGRLEMVNHQTKKSTTLLWTSYKFKNGFSKSDFSKNSLKRAR